MLYALIALALILLIFLLVYNTRVARKSDNRQKTELDNTEPAGPEVIDRIENRPSGKIIEIEQHSRTSQNMSDQDYREALRQFSNQNKPPKQEEFNSKPEKTSDEAYREALRSMAKRD
ncbi:hypothetical protein PASE110613_12330 [Paenibacillus sediminis]|uniref:Uncharacterized protein n=1 Tax=Paenibacillus sediminis TaxID=664909 RepID=A0ABS4H579_9BACL|nr:hypothetical protein [Paenibacillus sediminis]MBP1937688.1 hypothetical protein [Paenibacillus sediminis]